jgi:hypothetical protein
MLDAQGTRMLSAGSEATDRRGDAVPWHPGTPLADVVTSSTLQSIYNGTSSPPL